MDQLKEFPCFSFEQAEEDFYFAEEILSENIYPQTIKVNDRSTMLNLIDGLNGYTLCSGIIYGKLNGGDHVIVSFEEDENNTNSLMTIGYITKKNAIPSQMGDKYIEELKKYFSDLSDKKYL